MAKVTLEPDLGEGDLGSQARGEHVCEAAHVRPALGVLVEARVHAAGGGGLLVERVVEQRGVVGVAVRQIPGEGERFFMSNTAILSWISYGINIMSIS